MGPDMGAMGETAIDWYGYVPKTAAGIVFALILGLLTLVNFAENAMTKIDRMGIVYCGMSETIRWSCRLISSRKPEAFNPYFVQSVCLLSALFLSRFLWPMLSVAVANRQAYCRLSHKIIGRLGGVEALCPVAVCFAFAVQGADVESVVRKLKLASSVIYLGSMFAFAVLSIEFGIRVRRNQPYRGVPVGQEVSRAWVIEIGAMTISSLLMLLRACYHVAVYSQDSGSIHHKESLEIALDAVPMVLSLAILFLVNGSLLPSQTLNTAFAMHDLE